MSHAGAGRRDTRSTKTFENDAHITYLDYGNSFMDVYIYVSTHQNVHFRYVQFIFYVIYSSIKGNKKVK